MKNKVIISGICLLLCAIPAIAQKSERGVVKMGKDGPAVVEKGTWMIGGSITGTSFRGENYSLAIIEGINTHGSEFSIKPKVTYMFHKNFGVGIRGKYTRGMFDLAHAGVSISDISIDVEDLFSIKQTYGADVFARAYLPLGNSGRFAIIGDVYIGGDGGTSKLSAKEDNQTIGTYQTNWAFNAGVDFGAMAFLTKNLALEAELGILGFGVTGSNAVRNQIYEGGTKSVNAYYSVNFLSLSVGAAFYF